MDLTKQILKFRSDACVPNKYVLYSFTASDVVCYVSVLCEVLPCVNVAEFDMKSKQEVCSSSP